MSDAQALALSTGSGTVTPRRPSADAGLRLLAAAALVCAVLAATAFLATAALLPPTVVEELNSSVAAVLRTVGMVGLALAGAVLARQQPRSTMAWLMLGAALAWLVSIVPFFVALWLLDRGSAVAQVAGWVTNWVWVVAYALSMVMLLRLPTGRLPGPRWRLAERAVLAWAAITGATTALLPGPLGAEVLAPLTNPLGVEALGPVADGLLSALFAVLPVLIVVSAASLVVRWRRAGTRERGALGWVALAAVAVGISAPLALASETGEILQGAAGLLLPVAIGGAVLREELWDLDLRRRYDRLRLTRDQERARLRRELHDSLGPVLGSISMRAEAARNLLATGDTQRVEALLDSIGTETEGALTEVRRLIDDLGPTAVHDHDLVPALTVQLAAYADHFPVTLEVRPDPLPQLEERVAATAYLVVGEGVRNAARHSGGTGARVMLQVTGDRLSGEVRDDGAGLQGAPAGVGRSGMATRIAEEGGTLTVQDGPSYQDGSLPVRDGGTGDDTGSTLRPADGRPGVVVRFELPGALR